MCVFKYSKFLVNTMHYINFCGTDWRRKSLELFKEVASIKNVSTARLINRQSEFLATGVGSLKELLKMGKKKKKWVFKPQIGSSDPQAAAGPLSSCLSSTVCIIIIQRALQVVQALGTELWASAMLLAAEQESWWTTSESQWSDLAVHLFSVVKGLVVCKTHLYQCSSSIHQSIRREKVQL